MLAWVFGWRPLALDDGGGVSSQLATGRSEPTAAGHAPQAGITSSCAGSTSDNPDILNRDIYTTLWAQVDKGVHHHLNCSSLYDADQIFTTPYVDSR